MLGVLREYVTRENVGLYMKPLWFVFYMCVAAFVAQIIFRYFSEPLNHALRRGVSQPSADYVRQ